MRHSSASLRAQRRALYSCMGGGSGSKVFSEENVFESDLDNKEGVGESRGEVISSWRNSMSRGGHPRKGNISLCGWHIGS